VATASLIEATTPNNSLDRSGGSHDFADCRFPIADSFRAARSTLTFVSVERFAICVNHSREKI
jgi:hypothetical protein